MLSIAYSVFRTNQSIVSSLKETHYGNERTDSKYIQHYWLDYPDYWRIQKDKAITCNPVACIKNFQNSSTGIRVFIFYLVITLC